MCRRGVNSSEMLFSMLHIWLPTFGDNGTGSFSRNVRSAGPLRTGTGSCPVRSVTTNLCCLTSQKKDALSRLITVLINMVKIHFNVVPFVPL
jgi:hypothetical protein